ncbi:MAG: hypothetical protein ACKO37_01930 [Vampirovibrionales bacterium]
MGFISFEKLNPRWVESLRQAQAHYQESGIQHKVWQRHFDTSSIPFKDDLRGMFFSRDEVLRWGEVPLEPETQRWIVRHKVFDGGVLQYAHIQDGVYEDCAFLITTLDWVTFERCTFRRCFFKSCLIEHTRFMDAIFEQCIFEGSMSFHNCQFEGSGNTDTEKQAGFYDCTGIDVFMDCWFNRWISFTGNTSKQLFSFYDQLQSAYRAGDALSQARYYAFQLEAIYTRKQHGRYRYLRLADEYITGYRLRPIRILMSILACLAFFATVYSLTMPELQHSPDKAMMLSAGAFYTFGMVEGTQVTLHHGLAVIFVFEAFLGILMNGLLLMTLQTFLLFGQKGSTS